MKFESFFLYRITGMYLSFPSHNYLKKLRKALNLTMRQVEIETGIRKATISRIENGKDAMHSAFTTLAEFYNTKITEHAKTQANEQNDGFRADRNEQALSDKSPVQNLDSKDGQERAFTDGLTG